MLTTDAGHPVAANGSPRTIFLLAKQFLNRFRFLIPKHNAKPEAPRRNAGTKPKERPFTMKLRNLLITAALFLSAGVAFAGHSIDTDTYDINDFTFTANGNHIDVFLNKGNQTGFDYALYDVSAYDDISGTNKWQDVLDNYSGTSLWTIQSGNNSIDLPESGTELGVLCITHKVYSSDNPESKWLFFRVKGTSFSANSVSFGKLDDNGSGNNKTATVSFDTVGSPLPAPVATLLIALAFGAGFVMYRNRKQAKA